MADLILQSITFRQGIFGNDGFSKYIKIPNKNGHVVNTLGLARIARPRAAPTKNGDFLLITRRAARAVNITVNIWLMNQILPIMESHQKQVPMANTEVIHKFPVRLVGINPLDEPISSNQKTNNTVIDPHQMENITIFKFSNPKIAIKGINIKAGNGGFGTYHCP